MDTLFSEIKARGIPFDHHESDLYIPVTRETCELVAQFGHSSSTFVSQTDGKVWFDIPFAYLPWWEEKTRGGKP